MKKLAAIGLTALLGVSSCGTNTINLTQEEITIPHKGEIKLEGMVWEIKKDAYEMHAIIESRGKFYHLSNIAHSTFYDLQEGDSIELLAKKASKCREHWEFDVKDIIDLRIVKEFKITKKLGTY